ncbi:hypothetical protein [Priestia koreensis]|uniref:hypothetical protein n=1 Tax=Priestia koreensis TaxID=284581 RepID=UPI00203F2EA3|nr:hypothetical protein [Priestia koreensis]MCM3004014.1 hypothetical protein [Priestia koreensis]
MFVLDLRLPTIHPPPTHGASPLSFLEEGDFWWKSVKNYTIEEWYFEYEGELDDFFSSVENADVFQLARDAKPSEFSVYIEEI